MVNNCHICGGTFTSDESFSSHILNDHGNVDQLKCSLCDKGFESNGKLEVHMMVTHPEEPTDHSEEEIEDVQQTFKFRWVKGYNHNNPNNPGILIVNEEARFAFNKMAGNGLILHYHCLKKAATKCKAKCIILVETILEEDVEKTKYIVEKKTELNDHNHEVDEADVIIAEIVNEMHKEFRKNLTLKPSVIRKQIMQKYRGKYSNSDKWIKVIDGLPDNASIDRGIARIREQVWGKMPKNRDDMDYKKVLDTVEGGSVVEVMDSDKMWESKHFRQELVKIGVLKEDFEDLEDDTIPDNPLKRIIAFTSKQQLEIFETCEKGSVDGNFKVAPIHFSQVFVMMLKFDEKWVPVSFALLPTKDEIYYKLFFIMLKFELNRRNIPIALKKLIVDFEVAIQMSALSVFDQLVILGCFFHFGQCLLRKVQSSRMVSAYKSNNDFSKLVRRCISLPFVRLNELQDTVDQLRDVDFEEEEINEMKEEFMEYIQSTWIDGQYPPHTWNCFGRNNENTNNNIERYNGILNRLIQVQHPNAYVLLSHFVTEICSAIWTIEQLQGGKILKTKRTIYVDLGEERKELQKRYLKGLLSRNDFLLRMGFKLIKLNQESKRRRKDDSFEEPSLEDNNDEEGIMNTFDNSEDGTAHSFEDTDNPYADRVVGVTAGVMRRKKDKDDEIRRKKCQVCDKRFINGKIRKSKVVQCISCDRLTHERCANSEHTIFKCIVCRSMQQEDDEIETELDTNLALDASNVGDSNDNSISRDSDLDVSEAEFRTGIPATSSVNGQKRKLSNTSEEEFTESILSKSGRISESLEKLIEPPGERTIQEQNLQNARYEEIEKQRKERHERMEEIEEEHEEWVKQDQIMKQQELLEKDRCKENRDKIINNLTGEHIKSLFSQNIKYLEDIANGKIDSWRQNVFRTPGSEAVLRQHWIGDPYTDEQFCLIAKLTEDIFKDKEHVQAVLLPELLIKMYKDFLHISSKEEAVSMIQNPGSLSPEDDVSFGDFL
jgi:hypothetical protein